MKILLLMLLLIPISCKASECNRDIDSLSKYIHVPIHCQSVKTSSLISGTQPTDGELNAAYRSLLSFGASYNKDFISHNAREINLLHNLSYQKIIVGGLSAGDSIYLNIKDDISDQKFLDFIYIRALHHEFSSSIYRRTSYENKRKWRMISGEYKESSEYLKKCLENTIFARETSDELLKNGFLNNYSMTDSENDVNVFAEMLFTEPVKLERKETKYYLIRQKTNLLKKIYIEAGFAGKFPDEP